MMHSFVNYLPLGVRYMIVSGLAFSVMALFVKAAGNNGIPVIQIVAVRAAISLVISYFTVRGKGIRLFGDRKALLFARGAVGFVALIFVFYGLTHLPLAEATVLQYLYPMFTALLALVFLREPASRATLICMALSFIGLLCVVRPSFILSFDLGFLHGTSTQQSPLPPLAVIAAMAGALGSAIAYVLVRKLSQTEHSAVIVMYFPLVSLPASIPLLWNNFVMPDAITWTYLLGVGITTQIGQVALTRGMQLEPAARAASFSYLQVVFAIILGVVFYAEIPSAWTLVGALLIIGGAYINVAGGKLFKAT